MRRPLWARKERDRNADPEEKDPSIEDGQPAGKVEGFVPDLRGVPAMSPTQAASQGVPELRLLRRPSGRRGRVGKASPVPRKETALEKALGVRFKSPALREAALTHRSYAFEQGVRPTNERLEFLGDAVLGLAVTDVVYRAFPDRSEGELAKLRAAMVNMTMLAEGHGLRPGGGGPRLQDDPPGVGRPGPGAVA